LLKLTEDAEPEAEVLAKELADQLSRKGIVKCMKVYDSFAKCNIPSAEEGDSLDTDNDSTTDVPEDL